MQIRVLALSVQLTESVGETHRLLTHNVKTWAYRDLGRAVVGATSAVEGDPAKAAELIDTRIRTKRRAWISPKRGGSDEGCYCTGIEGSGG
jgi:hypothetical protein